MNSPLKAHGNQFTPVRLIESDLKPKRNAQQQL